MKIIEELLARAFGLDAASVGPALIERQARSRMKRLRLSRVEDYHRLLESSPAERLELIEALIVTETWFFRDREPFSALARMARQRWLSARSPDVLRVLSVPCASGEEPYSAVMTLLDAGMPAGRFFVEGIDISARALDRARRALYGRNSFRDRNLWFRNRYFHESREGYVLNGAVRKLVYFHQGNLPAENFTPARTDYDFIFCRNLLIYLDPAARRRVFDRLRSLLRKSGILFVGGAEASLAVEQGFVPADARVAFACQPANGATRRAPADQAAAAMESAPQLAAQPPTRPVRRSADLGIARRLADAGRLLEAAEVCRAHLRHYGASASAYYLLGLVHDARAQPQAIDYYRKALYLEPDHDETLSQLALIAQQKGDLAQAQSFRRRAQRAQQKTWTNCE